jgi:uncharacterized damage-inducible protein DinB
MKKPLFFITLISMFTVIGSPVLAQQNEFIRDYVERLKNSKKYLTLVAEKMPENKYDFKATEESKSFAENLMHLGWAMDWHSQSLLGGREPRDWRTDTELRPSNKSKAEMIAKIEETFDKTIQLVSEFNVAKLDDKLDYFGLNRSKRQVMLLLTDHITHHRAQMLVSLRLNGVVPPRYIDFQ